MFLAGLKAVQPVCNISGLSGSADSRCGCADVMTGKLAFIFTFLHWIGPRLIRIIKNQKFIGQNKDCLGRCLALLQCQTSGRVRRKQSIRCLPWRSTGIQSVIHVKRIPGHGIPRCGGNCDENALQLLSDGSKLFDCRIAPHCFELRIGRFLSRPTFGREKAYLAESKRTRNALYPELNFPYGFMAELSAVESRIDPVCEFAVADAVRSLTSPPLTVRISVHLRKRFSQKILSNQKKRVVAAKVILFNLEFEYVIAAN